MIREEQLNDDSRYVLARGPLKEAWKIQVREAWGEYDRRVLDAEEWQMQFEKGLLGPTWHSMIIVDDLVVGHWAIIPVEYTISQRRISGGVPEALYLLEAHRGARPIQGRLGFYAFFLIQQTMRSIRDDLGLAFGLFTPGRWPGLLEKIGGCKTVDARMTTSILATDWLSNRRRVKRRVRARDYAIHAALVAYEASLDWLAVLLGKRESAHVVQEFGPDVDRLVADLGAHYNGIIPSSDYLNSRFWGDSYIKIVIGQPAIGYLVFRRPKGDTIAAKIVDYYVPGGGFGFRRSLYVGKLIRKILRDSRIGQMSGQTFQLGLLAKRWSRTLAMMGFVKSGPGLPVQFQYYSTGQNITLNRDWHVTYLFRERL